MNGFEEITFDPAEFSGQARLFPLPNMVMFPFGVQALHIFEPRYCRLLQDAMLADKLIAMARLLPGWEAGYEENPPIAPVVCLGRVSAHIPLEKGKHNIMLVGLKRAKILEELPLEKGYRRANVELLDDHYPALSAVERPDLKERLIAQVSSSLRADSLIHEQIAQLSASQAPLGMLVDVLASALSAPLDFKQMLLEECDVDRRAEAIIAHFQGDSPSRRPYPPPPSMN